MLRQYARITETEVFFLKGEVGDLVERENKIAQLATQFGYKNVLQTMLLCANEA